MNRRAVFLTFVVLGALAAYVFSNMGRLAIQDATRARQLRLERAVMAVEGTFSSMTDAGYIEWTPTKAAIELVRTMTAAEKLTPEEAKEFGLRASPAPTRYVIGKPTGPWQVVLLPDEAHKLVRVEGYGADVERPLIVRQIAVGD